VYHGGKLLHGVDVVTSGERTVLVGFVHVQRRRRRRRQQPSVLAQACRDWGRMDEAKRRLGRQMLRRGQPMHIHRWFPHSVSLTRRAP
jgi:hypothetical protein